MKREMYRQGDVLLIRVEALPPGAEELEPGEQIVLAYGEVTGHAHTIASLSAQMFADGEVRYLNVNKSGADLTHQEHAAIHLAPGLYRIHRQREYVPDASRLVSD